MQVVCPLLSRAGGGLALRCYLGVVELMLIGFGAAVRFGLQIDAVENMALFGEFDPSGDGSINYYEFIERNELRLSNRIESRRFVR